MNPDMCRGFRPNYINSPINRQERRVQKAIDEIIKIQDDGKGNEKTERILDMLRELESEFAGSH